MYVCVHIYHVNEQRKVTKFCIHMLGGASKNKLKLFICQKIPLAYIGDVVLYSLLM